MLSKIISKISKNQESQVIEVVITVNYLAARIIEEFDLLKVIKDDRNLFEMMDGNSSIRRVCVLCLRRSNQLMELSIAMKEYYKFLTAHEVSCKY